jgi:hypothetical protein
MTISTRHWKDPKSPVGDEFHLNCLTHRMVKAVYFRHLGLSIICQNPDVKSMGEKIVDPAQPISWMHSCTSLIEYLSTMLLVDCPKILHNLDGSVLLGNHKHWTVDIPVGWPDHS